MDPQEDVVIDPHRVFDVRVLVEEILIRVGDPATLASCGSTCSLWNDIMADTKFALRRDTTLIEAVGVHNAKFGMSMWMTGTDGDDVGGAGGGGGDDVIDFDISGDNFGGGDEDDDDDDGNDADKCSKLFLTRKHMLGGDGVVNNGEDDGGDGDGDIIDVDISGDNFGGGDEDDHDSEDVGGDGENGGDGDDIISVGDGDDDIIDDTVDVEISGDNFGGGYEDDDVGKLVLIGKHMLGGDGVVNDGEDGGDDDDIISIGNGGDDSSDDIVDVDISDYNFGGGDEDNDDGNDVGKCSKLVLSGKHMLGGDGVVNDGEDVGDDGGDGGDDSGDVVGDVGKCSKLVLTGRRMLGGSIPKLFPELNPMYPSAKRLVTIISVNSGVEMVVYVTRSTIKSMAEFHIYRGRRWSDFKTESGISQGDRVDIYTGRRGGCDRCLLFLNRGRA